MAGGHSVNTDELAAAGKTLHEVPRGAVEQPLSAVKNVSIGAQDFGRAHTDRAQAHIAGVQKLAASAEAYLTASDTFGDKISGAGTQYASNEEQTSQEIGRHQP